MDPGQLLERLELSPPLAWLFRSQLRSLTVHEHGLVVERGTGTRFIPWAKIRSVTAGQAETVANASGTTMSVRGFFKLEWEDGPPVQLPASAARVSGQRLAQLVVERANLEWFYGEASGRQLPPVAVKPHVATNLRAALEALRR